MTALDQPTATPRSAKKKGRKRAFLIPAGTLVLGIIIGASTGGGDSATTTAAVPTPTVTVTAPAAEQAAAAAAPAAVVPSVEAAAEVEPAPAAGTINDGDWSASDIQLEDSLGSFGGTIRLTGPDATGASVQLTVLSGGSVVATLIGASNDFSGTETVSLISTDDYTAGDYSYELKVTSF